MPEQIQGPAFDAAWEECKASLPPPPERESEEDFRELYELWIGQYDCLSDAGFVLDERPTFEVWLYRIIYSDEKPIEILWSGHDAATALVGAPEDYLRAISTCAPITDNW